MKVLSIVVIAALTASFQAHACGAVAESTLTGASKQSIQKDLNYLTEARREQLQINKARAGANAINEAKKK